MQQVQCKQHKGNYIGPDSQGAHELVLKLLEVPVGVFRKTLDVLVVHFRNPKVDEVKNEEGEYDYSLQNHVAGCPARIGRPVVLGIRNSS